MSAGKNERLLVLSLAAYCNDGPSPAGARCKSLRGPFCGCPCNTSPTVWSLYHGPLSFGDSHLEIMGNLENMMGLGSRS